MAYLRRISDHFAAKYPKVSNRLGIGQGEFADPHTERLMESFAFLTARLQQDIDNQFPHVSSALLDILYPHLANPIPAMTIANFRVDPSVGKMTTNYKVKKGSELFTHTKNDQVCRFKTCYETDLWPVTVEEVKLHKTSTLPP